ncbi:MAG TPA: phosphatase domain-containing protein [Pyrinomonadaceae bacterium]|jgi:hypothetical protein
MSDLFKKIKDTVEDGLEDVKETLDDAMEAGKDKLEGTVRGLKRDKEVVVYPTYGYLNADKSAWVIPMRVWVNKARRAPVSDEVIGIFVRDMHLEPSEIGELRTRIKHFLADDDSGEFVSLKFDDDPEDRLYALPGKTDFNGLIQHDLELPLKKAEALRASQNSASGWLKFKAIAEGFEGKGKARLLESEGLSIVSDIDDTIKITEVPAGVKVVLRNAFVRPYVPAPGMLERYRAFGGHPMFHYVSGSPWQMFHLLDKFLISDTGFPEGAFHMKNVRKNLLVPDSWQDFKNLAAGDEATLVQKVGQITRLLQNLPQRKFILIGDSGEKDPEVFREIRKTFPSQVQEIIIRDVVAERDKPGSTRLEGMTVIPAPTVVRGVSQFD